MPDGGDPSALTIDQKRGALVFFGKGKCVKCHAVSGNANEMFSDFQNYNIGVPQIAPEFGIGKGNMIFDGPNKDEDFGLEQVTGNPADRYKFRASPLRNVSQQPAFFHNGAFTRLEDAIRHHLDVRRSARLYNPVLAGVDPDLTHRVGPVEPVLQTIHPLVSNPIDLTPNEFANLVEFVRNGLLDVRARREVLCLLIPDSVPSGMPPLKFEGCR
jgi:cytochrome c peroxidase